MVNFQANAIGHVLHAHLAGIVVSFHNLLPQGLSHSTSLSSDFLLIN